MVNEVAKPLKEEDSESKEEIDTQNSKGRWVAMVTSCRCLPEGGETNKSMNRRWKEIMSVAFMSTLKTSTARTPLSFGNQDFLNGKPNKYI